MVTARWIRCPDPARLAEFRRRNGSRLALDAMERLAFLAPSRVALDLAGERWPEIEFQTTREL